MVNNSSSEKDMPARRAGTELYLDFSFFDSDPAVLQTMALKFLTPLLEHRFVDTSQVLSTGSRSTRMVSGCLLGTFCNTV